MNSAERSVIFIVNKKCGREVKVDKTKLVVLYEILFWYHVAVLNENIFCENQKYLNFPKYNFKFFKN